MDIYSKGSTPKLNKPGSDCFYEGASSFQAIEIDSVESAVMKELTTLDSDFSTYLTNFKKNLDEMELEFGEKFMTINDKKLGFVNLDAFMSLIDRLKEDIESSRSDSESFFSTCSSEITAINAWLNELEENASNYASASRSYDSYSGKSDANSKEQAAYYKGIMDQYKQLSGDPMSYGDWIRK